MQYFATILAAAGLANAAAIIPRTTSFTIAQFGFSGTPHSTIASYSFDVSDGISPSTRCQTTTNTSPAITTFNLVGCEDPSWSFAWQPINQSNDTQVIVTHKPKGASSNITAYRTFTPEDIKLQDGVTPTGNVYYLSTGKDGAQFTMTTL